MAVTDQPKSTPEAAETEAVGPGNVDQIRDIIFGPQMHEYERRLGRLEQRVERELTALRDDTARRLDALEEYVKREIEPQLGRPKAETDERTTAAQRELRTALLEQSQRLREDLRRAEETLSTKLSGVAEELRQDKAGRDEVAGLFVALARHLDGDNGERLRKEGSGPANAWR